MNAKDAQKLAEEITESEGLFDSVMDALEVYITDSIVPGICTKCRAVASSCEPDARNNHCEECESPSVIAITELVFYFIG